MSFPKNVLPSLCAFSKHLVYLHVWKLQSVDPSSIQKLILLGDQHLQSIG